MRYIPPYCHFLSPLDNGAFGALVRWLRANYEYVQRVGIMVALETAVRELNRNPKLARWAFKNCEYL